jgi:adenylate cyclase
MRQIPADRRIQFRMGVNVGDVVEGTSIHGDGINVAARLEALAEAGGICVSSRVQEDAKGSLGRLGVAFENLGQHQLKNIDHAVQIYRVLLDHAATTVKPKQALTPELALPDKPSVAVLPFANLSSDPELRYSRAAISGRLRPKRNWAKSRTLGNRPRWSCDYNQTLQFPRQDGG